MIKWCAESLEILLNIAVVIGILIWIVSLITGGKNN